MEKKKFMGGFHLESNTSNPVKLEASDFFAKRGEKLLEYFPEVQGADEIAAMEFGAAYVPANGYHSCFCPLLCFFQLRRWHRDCGRGPA